MSAPAWLAATAGFPGQAGQVNQFLTTHSSTWTYSGSTLQSEQTTGASTFVSTEGLYVAQQIQTGATQTSIGIVNLQVSTVGGSPIGATITPLTVSLYLMSSGLPIGSALATGVLTEQAVYLSPFWVPVTINASGLTPTTDYALIISAAGTSSAYYVWQRSNQLTGALTAPDDITWTAQPYGFMYQVYDSTGTSWPPLFLTDDDGARLTTLTYGPGSQLTGITEQVTAQGTTDFTSSRTITYSGIFPIGVA
jgi:hypothetical protein